jgi:metal-dependent amidase/aminoacylase/carboxypeptidase family protein
VISLVVFYFLRVSEHCFQRIGGFALIAERVPGAYLYLSAGFSDEHGQYGSHHSKVRFNEEVLPIGAASLAHCAMRWLQEHK